MKKEDFDKLFGEFSDYDLLSIAEIRHILINENEMENKINSFLNTKIEIYAFSHNFRCDVRLMNVLRDYFGFYDEKKKRTILDITFRDLLKLCDWDLDSLLHLRHFGRTTLESIVDIYKANGINPYEYRE